MADIRERRRRMLTIVVLLICIDIAAAVVLLSPIGKASRERQDQMKQLRAELARKNAEAVPLNGIDGKIAEARQQIDGFYKDRLASRYSQISEQLGNLATENHVTLSNVNYHSDKALTVDLRRVEMDATLSGDYVNVMKFINAVERSRLFFLIDNVTLGSTTRTGTQGAPQRGQVNLSIKFESFLKGEA